MEFSPLEVIVGTSGDGWVEIKLLNLVEAGTQIE